MKIGIIGAMEVEINTLQEKLANKKTTNINKFTFYEGTINDMEVVVLLSGIGKVSAAVGTTMLIERYQPDVIINTGTAGGLGDADVYDIIIGEEVGYHDVDITGFGYKMGQQAQMPPTFKADTSLVNIAKEVSKEHDKKVHCGLIVSGDSFINDPNRLMTIKNHFPKALAVEMEAAAISQVCHLFKVPFVVLRAISDKAGEGTTESYETFVEKAGTLSALMNIDFIKKITEKQQLWKK
ncbi:MAG: 5'-methylthioadenosine/adenosylhomocysteine nucleosidase [Flavobacteriaceae bacterium]|nr:5'-methylthioadenosine/adenosylhomocysteine nucleosidase [Flavobacteriaceae bacterium]